MATGDGWLSPAPFGRGLSLIAILGFLSPLIEPCMRFSLTRLSCEKSETQRHVPYRVIRVQTESAIEVGARIAIPPASSTLGLPLQHATKPTLHKIPDVVEDLRGVTHPEVVDPSAQYPVRPGDLLGHRKWSPCTEGFAYLVPKTLLRLLGREVQRHPLRPLPVPGPAEREPQEVKGLLLGIHDPALLFV